MFGVHGVADTQRVHTRVADHTQVYSHHTKSSDLDVSAYGSDACVFMGAQRAGTLLYQLGAFCDAATFKPTAVPNQLVVGRGVKWYMLPGWSVG